jgi:hypothetical protein
VRFAKPSISWPSKVPSLKSGRTTIWLPIVWVMLPCPKIAIGVDQVSPPSVVRLKYAGPLNGKAFATAAARAWALGNSRRSHTA